MPADFGLAKSWGLCLAILDLVGDANDVKGIRLGVLGASGSGEVLRRLGGGGVAIGLWYCQIESILQLKMLSTLLVVWRLSIVEPHSHLEEARFDALRAQFYRGSSGELEPAIILPLSKFSLGHIRRSIFFASLKSS